MASPKWLDNSSVAPKASNMASVLRRRSPENKEDLPVSPVLSKCHLLDFIDSLSEISCLKYLVYILG